MDILVLIFDPWGLWFTIPLGAALGWFTLGAVLGGFGDAHADADADGDAHVDVHGHGEDIHGSSVGSTLAFLGIGRMPLLLWLQVLCILWGSTGLITRLAGGPVWLAFLLASGTALPATTTLSYVLAKVLPKRIETDALDHDSMRGLEGTVISHGGVDQEYGAGRFLGPKGPLYLSIRRARGEERLPYGTTIVIYEVDRGTLLVAPLGKLLDEG